jgi:hypothetical protein
MSWFEDFKEKVSTWEREHFFWAEMSAIVGAIILVLKWFLHATGLEPKLIATAQASPVIFGFIVLLAVAVLVLSLVVSSLLPYRRLCCRLGARSAQNFRSQRDPFKSRGAFFKRLEKHFMSTSQLRILGATGLKTIGFVDPVDPTNKALLHDLFVGPKLRGTSIDVLLLDPNSDYMIARARTLYDNSSLEIRSSKSAAQFVNEYRDEILQSIEYCAGLAANLPKLRCYTYDNTPIWKLILTDHLVWQQSYPAKAHVENSWVNIFENPPDGNDEKNALYPPFSKLFDLLRDAASEMLDLRQIDKELKKIQAEWEQKSAVVPLPGQMSGRAQA